MPKEGPSTMTTSPTTSMSMMELDQNTTDACECGDFHHAYHHACKDGQGWQELQSEKQLDLLTLPDELLVRVVASLSSLADASNAMAACQRLYSINSDDHYWRSVVKGKWGLRGRGLRQSAGVDVPWRSYVREKLSLFRNGAIEWELKTRSGLSPVSRYTHTGTAVGRKIYYIGGQSVPQGPRLNDILVFDVDKEAFEIVVPVSGKAPNFARHTAVAINKQIWMFGGYDGVATFFSLAVFDTEKLTWTYPQVHGEPPSPRSNHTAAAVGKKLYMFGGSANFQGAYTILGDFHELDTETMTWTRLDTGVKNSPSPRVGHRMAAIGHRVYMFGGGVWSTELGWHTKFNELCIYDTRAKKWMNLPKSVRSPPVCSYPFMFTMGCHLFLFGGQSLTDIAVTNELYILDTMSLTWTKAEAPQVTGEFPGPRDMGAANVVGNRCVFFGGYSGGSLMEDVDFWELKFHDVSFIKDLTSSP